MIRKSLLFAVFLVYAFGPPGQQVIENPANLPAKNAGRLIELKEAWRISDQEGRFFFINPRDLRVASDGSVFISDEKELLKFSARGEFLKNLYIYGQGPGEVINDVLAFTIREKELILFDFMARNILILDLEGNLLRQFRIETGPYSGFFGVFDEDGRYLDNFHLGAGRTLLRVIGNKICVTEKNPDESLTVVKYKIAG